MNADPTSRVPMPDGSTPSVPMPAASTPSVPVPAASTPALSVPSTPADAPAAARRRPVRAWLRACLAVAAGGPLACVAVHAAPDTFELRTGPQASETLTLVPDRVLEPGAGGRPRLRPAGSVGKSAGATPHGTAAPAGTAGAAGAAESGAGAEAGDGTGAAPVPVYRDRRGQLFAPVGGVVVTARPGQADAVRSLLEADGLKVRHRIGDNAWLVESGPGTEALELASRLAGSGRFASATPNAWRPRVPK